MKRLIPFLIILLGPWSGRIAVAAVPLEIMIASSDLIVKGKVVRNSAHEYDVKVYEVLKGNCNKRKLLIYKPKEKTDYCHNFCSRKGHCNHIVKGKEMYFFLNKSGITYKVVGGEDGQICVKDGKVLFDVKPCSCTNGPCISEFDQAIRDFSKCYVYDRTRKHYKQFVQVVDLNTISCLSKTGPFSHWLFSRVEKHNIQYPIDLSKAQLIQ